LQCLLVAVLLDHIAAGKVRLRERADMEPIFNGSNPAKVHTFDRG